MVTHIGGDVSEDERMRTYCRILDIILSDAQSGEQDETEGTNDAEA